MFRRLLELRDLVKESETLKEKQTQDMALRNPAAALLVRLHCHELIDPVCRCQAFAFEELDLQHEACRRHVPASGTTTSSHHLHWKKIDLHLERILATEASAAHPSVVEQRRKNKRCLNLVKQPLEPLLELRGLQRHKVSFMELGLQAAVDLLLLEEPKVMESLRHTVPPDGHAWTDVELSRLRRVLDDIGVGRQLLREEAVGGQICILSGGGGDNELRMWDLVEGICLMVMPAPTPATHRDPSSASGHLAVVNNSVAAPGPSGTVAAPQVPVAGVMHASSVVPVAGVMHYASSVVPVAGVMHASSVVPVAGVMHASSVVPVAGVMHYASSVATGHSDRVFGVVVSQDGSAAWSAGWDHKVLKWELATGAQVQDVKFEGHQGWVTGIALTPDESRVVTCCWDKVVRVWGADDGRLKASLQGHSDSVECISVSPDGLYAASGGWDHALCIWDMNNLKLRDCMKVHSEVVMGVDVCGNKVLSGSDDGTAKLWKLSARGTLSKRPVMELKGHSGGVTDVAFSPDGTFAFTASKDGTLRYWDVEAAPITSLSNRAGAVGGAASASANCLAVLKGHTDWVMSLAVAPNGRTVVSGGRDRVVMVWDVLGGGSGSHNATSVAGPAISSAAPAPLKMPATGLGALSTLKPIKKLEGHSGCVWSVSIVPNVGHGKLET
ncbi:hypothetical protein CEUSTIGMA_g7674.t1 [Chlamydomonas eustigma]|uniref:Uncharacterized protein n=1 Tax=Chlamydomonas eustigma TaxID=1157962 RepID=A0A250XB02_9CHLO|nr:hypothetical protein CEUSTIGMA_g7674.t1 [Chlamydomonas eustigma]|eukprot:GAX80236.1 hypothetical protein CEUSTIGMA_g7674.t1 [Chlamydomonas eustigma]